MVFGWGKVHCDWLYDEVGGKGRKQGKWCLWRFRFLVRDGIVKVGFAKLTIYSLPQAVFHFLLFLPASSDFYHIFLARFFFCGSLWWVLDIMSCFHNLLELCAWASVVPAWPGESAQRGNWLTWGPARRKGWDFVSWRWNWDWRRTLLFGNLFLFFSAFSSLTFPCWNKMQVVCWPLEIIQEEAPRVKSACLKKINPSSSAGPCYWRIPLNAFIDQTRFLPHCSHSRLRKDNQLQAGCVWRVQLE